MLYLFLATGFEEIEAVATIDVIRRANIDITTVSVTGQRLVTGAHNIAIEADRLFEDTDFVKAQMLILPGGMPGTLNLEKYEPLITLIKNHNKVGGRIAAICAAPSILGHLHILRNQQAVCHPGFEQELTGAFNAKENVVVSGNIITAKGPGFAAEFGLKIVEAISGPDAARQVADGMLIKK